MYFSQGYKACKSANESSFCDHVPCDIREFILKIYNRRTSQTPGHLKVTLRGSVSIPVGWNVKEALVEWKTSIVSHMPEIALRIKKWYSSEKRSKLKWTKIVDSSNL